MKKLLFATQPLPSRLTDITWLLFRLHLGLSIAIGAGWSKLVHLTTAQEAAQLTAGVGPLGPPDWFVKQVATLGFSYPTPYLWAWLAAWGEFAGGLLVAIGLLTRWSGLQLAFQFLIIAFLWYDKPEPILGMYYQQLLFWAFTLVTVIGGGRYSLDHWLWQKSRSIVSASQLISSVKMQAAALLVLLAAGTAAAQAKRPPAKVAMQELQAIAQQWNGSLTYLDYTTNKPVTLVTTLNGMQSAPNELVLDFIYQEPEGGQVTGYDKVQVSADGKQLVWDGVPLRISSKTRLPNQVLQLVLVGRGLDNKKPCLIKRTLEVGPQLFAVRKEVKYDDATDFITRNQYQFQR